MKRRKFTWTEFQIDKLDKVNDILAELKDYMPLTLRQIYYQMVGKGFIENKVSEYGMLSKLLKYARIDGAIDWDCIEDRVRAFHDLTGFNNQHQFIKQEVSNFLEGYKRELVQDQEKYIEVWIEKDALSSIFKRVCERYSVPVVVCRGFSSISFLNDFKNRLYYKTDKIPLMLYFGDFDPSGVEMLESMKTTLRDELNIHEIEFKRIALLKEDIFSFSLPHNPDALKKTDTRAKKHLEAFGELAVELDALRPNILEDKIISAIEGEIDLPIYNEALVSENNELDKLNRLKVKVIQFIGSDSGGLYE